MLKSSVLNHASIISHWIHPKMYVTISEKQYHYDLLKI